MNARLACTGAVAVWSEAALSTCGGGPWLSTGVANCSAGGVGIRSSLALCSCCEMFAGGVGISCLLTLCSGGWGLQG